MQGGVRFALVGCGRISEKHLESIKQVEGASLVAACDIKEERAKAIAEKYSCKHYIDYKEMLEKEDIDVVDICTPNYLHPEMCVYAAQKKKHVLTEKPMALTLQDAKRMIEGCMNNGVKLFVIKQNRYNPPIKKLKAALEKKRFGKTVLANVTVRWTRPQEYYDESEWHGKKALDGGMLFTQASHHIDMLEYLMGPIESVQAKIATLAHDIEIEDNAVAILKFKNGALGVMEATTCTFPQNLEGSITILGEKGTAKVGGVALNKVEHWNFKEHTVEDDNIHETTTFPSNVYGFGHGEVIKHVVDVLSKGKPLDVDGIEGSKSIKIIEAIYKAAELGREIDLESL